ncbi:2-octaprenyl-6-methoxyphenyl hydroxylase [Rickettsia prowazekii]|uniref:2-polyprenyl-6-methoxyphenol4-hydroxylase n=1 Tax=Rickettsia prowazekii (strain Rp22) TaxID=449216 RepID=D5AXF7_RICPP|nr:2-octaprenyl-6-methoxyphenyl hydroxylase [Rickettsia prowazekii]ADE30096.1 2-polyprenyl-6-methoxyphenol4-hydroxylase [Rickettsia prowazekii str. Rp22]AFE49362.1 2-octaprenyl-6-methoxyphenyl hydroxylase [Rickettsia prowazekii str. Chernikova]AFE50206.1 2-octaprenyl-6-methoxyphenyl hydroxylase [Rickettsia prowazekii str. Katsinyian]AFE51052.1 2-octaprenyl-6-methoxyphenyl hydroxylase [Rickettsia prowazekii str. BuV67-CWPP]AFE51888.1 2-octaprenyl-6-methoxyphenyl hydroxylase [Rickettsia prowazek
MSQIETDKMLNIVILGCGLSGMLTALSFAHKGIKTTILERKLVKSQDFLKDIRTTALTPYSKKFLFSIGIWKELEQFVAEMQDVYVVDNKASEILDLCNKNDAVLGYVVKNSDFKKILLSEITNNSLITLIDNNQYQEVISHNDYSIIKFNNDKQIKCDLLIICDGANSKVRSYYFTNEIDKPYQTALTFNVKHEKPHENCAMEHFLPLGPFALLPLKDQYSSSVIWSTSVVQAALIINLPTKEVDFLIQRNVGNFLGQITIESEISSFPLKAFIANRYFHNRIVLIADTAHIVHPLAGQGLNQGIKDIETLSMIMSNNGTLQEYQKLRQYDNFIMYKLTDSLNSIFSNYSKNLKCLRQIGFKAINNLKPIKNLITNYAMGQR